jgi:hypothetical protein
MGTLDEATGKSGMDVIGKARYYTCTGLRRILFGKVCGVAGVTSWKSMNLILVTSHITALSTLSSRIKMLRIAPHSRYPNRYYQVNQARPGNDCFIGKPSQIPSPPICTGMIPASGQGSVHDASSSHSMITTQCLAYRRIISQLLIIQHPSPTLTPLKEQKMENPTISQDKSRKGLIVITAHKHMLHLLHSFDRWKRT